MKEFENQVAIVTGTTGIGRAIAKRLAAGGCSVVACGIESSANYELLQEAQASGLSLLVETCDVSQPEQVKSVVAKTVKTHGGLDIIVNAAAIHPFGTAAETEPDSWNRCMAVNVGSIFLLAHFGIPEIKKRGRGSMVNLSSVQGHACQRGVVAYAASKGAVHSLTRALALDHAKDHIRVNAVAPGVIDTPMHKDDPKDFLKSLSPLGGIIDAQDIADAVLYLTEARQVTGELLRVDGGAHVGKW